MPWTWWSKPIMAKFTNVFMHHKSSALVLGCVIIAVLVTQSYQHPRYQQHALCGVPQAVRMAWLLLAESPFRAPWPIKGQHGHPMMPWEVKSFPVKRCCRTYARLGWHCYSALLWSIFCTRHIDGLVQYCDNYSVSALEVPQSCSKQSICSRSRSTY